MALMNIICADSPGSLSREKRLSLWNFNCAYGMGTGSPSVLVTYVLGFGGNAMTLLIITVVGILRRNVGERRKECLTGKIVMCLVPALGACMSFFDVVLIVKNAWSKDTILYHRLMFSCSRFSVWATTMLLSACNCWFFLMCNHIVCCWWIVKPLLSLPHLQITLSSSQALLSLEECSIVLLDFMFGASMNIIRMKHATSSKRLISQEEDPLLPYDLEFEEAHLDLGFQRFWNTLSFNSIKLVLDQGVMKQLEFDDLLPLPFGMDPSSCHNKLLSSLQAQQINPDSRPSIFKAICFAYGWAYFRLGLLKVLNDCIGFAGPLLLNKLIQFLQQGHRSLDGFALAISLGVASLLKSFLDTQYTYRLAKLKLKLRSSIMTIIYEKCLHVNVAERSEFSEGEIQTFMSVDADRIVNLCNSFHDMWSLPLQIGFALYLLYTQVKFAFLSGVAITVLLIPVNKWISKLIASATEKMMKQKDERIRRTGELLTQIRTLKLYGWEMLFAGWVMKTRSAEVTHLTTRKYLDAWCVFFWATTPTLFSLTTFGLFAITGNQLDAATAFTCVALFNTLISPLNSFPWVINGLIDAIISTSRLSRFFACSEEKSNSGAMSTSSEPSGLATGSESSDSNDKAVFMGGACFSWSSNIHANHGFKLGPVDLNLLKGSLIAIVGEVGSGKSSLLNSILGEMHINEGWVRAAGSMAYAPQVPWVLSGSIRDNILFGKEYNPKRYAEVIEACRLGVDFSQMSGGDMAYVGEKGANLSGGQRARLALARAIYNDADIFLLDDVLSAVDAQVGQCILHNAICGPLVKHRTRLLCTHNSLAIASADIVVLLDKGCIKFVGSPADLTFSQYSAHTPFAVCNSSQSVQSQKHKSCSAPAIVEENIQEKRDSISICSDVEEIIDTEERKEGKVELAVYRNYAAFSGWFVATVIFISAVLMQITRNGNDLWLSFWVDTTSGSDVGGYSLSFYVGVLSIFCLLNSILTLVRAFSFAFGGIRAAIRVHDMLLNTLVHVPLYFYDRTPCGRILNRLSSDLYTIDDSLPFILNILLANFVGLLGIAIVLTYVQVMFLLLLLPLWFIYRKLQFYYRSTSRELRRLDSVSRSPIYASFTETLDGSSTIRAFRSEDVFLERFINFVAIYQRTSYSELVASLWLSLRLQLLAACVISFIAILAVFGSHRDLPLSLGTPGLVGLALSYAAPVVSLLGSFLTSFTETEKEMVAIERVLQYMDIPQEQCDGLQPLSPDWPFKGQIEFCSVTMKYLPSLPAALLDVTFTIAGGTQVGIVGRTGAGKSSILNALFCLVPLSGGQIIVDGVNIGNTPVCELRSHLAVVPQSPFLFQGSLRDNLDPYRICDDGKLWQALEKCHMKEEVQASGGLEFCVKESGASFSVGQRQLLCLARAFLKSSKVLCLDECTANVDARTASILHKVISWECQGMTVITIAHRISSVLNMDKILVLEQGTLVEQGEPELLLLNEQSRFSSFARASSM